MRSLRLLPVVLTLTWALWFGGIVTVLLAVTSLFKTFAPDRTLAGAAAAGIFRRFEFYQLVLAAVAVLSATAWRTIERAGSGRKTLLLVLLLASGTLATVSTFVVSRRIEDLRRQRLTDTPEFRRLHGASMAVYLCEAAALLAAGAVLPGAITARLSDRSH